MRNILANQRPHKPTGHNQAGYTVLEALVVGIIIIVLLALLAWHK